MKHIVIAGGLLVLVGCSSITPITPAGNDTFVVGSKKLVDQADIIDVKSSALGLAIDFCNKQKKDIEELNAQAAVVPAPTSPQRVKVTFKCVARPNETVTGN